MLLSLLSPGFELPPGFEFPPLKAPNNGVSVAAKRKPEKKTRKRKSTTQKTKAVAAAKGKVDTVKKKMVVHHFSAHPLAQ
jgi:hypothetical protein